MKLFRIKLIFQLIVIHDTSHCHARYLGIPIYYVHNIINEYTYIYILFITAAVAAGVDLEIV